MKYFIFFFSILITIVCCRMAIRMILLYIHMRGWMKVKAKIISKDIQLKPGNPHPGKANYIPTIIYKYTLNEIEYTHTCVYPENILGGNRSFKKDTVQKMIDHLPSDPYIWVNPKEPRQAVMFRHGISVYFIILGLGVLSFIVGLGFMLGS